MSHMAGTQPDQTATVSAEQMLDRMGESIGSFAARSGQRMQQFTTRLRTKGIPGADKLQAMQRRSQVTSTSSSEVQTLPLEKAEAVIDTMQQRIALIASVVDLQSRRTMTRIREEAEDMLAEARQIRDAKRR